MECFGKTALALQHYIDTVVTCSRLSSESVLGKLPSPTTKRRKDRKQELFQASPHDLPPCCSLSERQAGRAAKRHTDLVSQQIQRLTLGYTVQICCFFLSEEEATEAERE
jgi:hypothetical protein